MTPIIGSYSFGQIEIDGERYRHDVIIYPERVHPEWWREQGHSLSVIDLEEIFGEQADVLIVGQGAYQRMQVPPKTRERIEQEGFELHVMGTAEAVDLYNSYRDKSRVIAALHLSC